MVYKIVIHKPRPGKGVWTKNLITRNLNEAIRETVLFEDEKRNSKYRTKIESEKSNLLKKEKGNPPLFIVASEKFLDTMKNVDIPIHLRKQRSEEHLKDIERELGVLKECLIKNNYDINSFTMEEFGDIVVGEVYQFLLNKRFSPRTRDKYMGTYKAFMSWCIEENDLPIKNRFKKVKKERLYPEPQAIPFKEIPILLSRITPENGKKQYFVGKGGSRYLFKPWLVAGFRLALETGARREELIRLKWSDVKEEDGLRFIETEDYKINRILSQTDPKRKKFKHFPITKSLNELLDELGYDIYKGTDRYIIAPELNDNRTKSMSDTLSKAFTHYYRQLNTGKNLTFKSLRKAYITNLQIQLGKGNIKSITGHTNDTTIEKSYIDTKIVAQSQYGKEIFHDDEERESEIEKVRIKKQSKNNSINKDR